MGEDSGCRSSPWQGVEEAEERDGETLFKEMVVQQGGYPLAVLDGTGWEGCDNEEDAITVRNNNPCILLLVVVYAVHGSSTEEHCSFICAASCLVQVRG